jgi:hypothetical protein
MTIHWKALEEHFLMGQLVLLFDIGEKNAFSEFSKKNCYVMESNCGLGTI